MAQTKGGWTCVIIMSSDQIAPTIAFYTEMQSGSAIYHDHS